MTRTQRSPPLGGRRFAPRLPVGASGCGIAGQRSDRFDSKSRRRPPHPGCQGAHRPKATVSQLCDAVRNRQSVTAPPPPRASARETTRRRCAISLRPLVGRGGGRPIGRSGRAAKSPADSAGCESRAFSDRRDPFPLPKQNGYRPPLLPATSRRRGRKRSFPGPDFPSIVPPPARSDNFGLLIGHGPISIVSREGIG